MNGISMSSRPENKKGDQPCHHCVEAATEGLDVLSFDDSQDREYGVFDYHRNQDSYAGFRILTVLPV